MKFFGYLFLLIFIVFALLQFNDPDPFIWVPIYLFSAYTSFCATRGYYNPMLLAILCIGYFLGAIFLFPESPSTWIHAEEQAKSLEMKVPFIEEARESLGLIICLLVNLVYIYKGSKGSKSEIPLYDKDTEKDFL